MTNHASTNPTVSVIMTVYNGEKYLVQAIQSVQAQTWTDFEVLIVDDGSTDQSSTILAQASEDPRITVITQPRCGRARALNIAWNRACGKYIANLDADDLAEPERLEKQVAFLEANPDVGLLGGQCTVIRSNQCSESQSPLPLHDVVLRKTFVRDNPFVHSAVMMRKDVLALSGGYNEKFKIAIDYELWVRMANYCKIANLPDTVAVKRFHDSAYFQRKNRSWLKYQTRIAIRWRAWRSLSGSVAELHFVFWEPVEQWLRIWIRYFCNRFLLSRQ